MRVTTALAIAGVLVFLSYEAVLRRRTDAAASWQGDDADRSSTRLIVVAYGAVVAINVVLGMASFGQIPPTWRWLGVGVLVVGLALRAWAMTTLGRFYTRTLRTVDAQQLVEAGPYRAVRHPGYSASLLVWVGYAIALGSWIGTTLTIGVLGPVYLWRINAEETLLRASFGDRYAAYQQRTKRLVPFVY
jgi:protein-S-isoprenylcysteine O-methyltransferase Ste14